WIWRPNPAHAATSRIGRLLRAFDLPVTADGYARLHRLSIAEPERFWRAALRDLGLEWEAAPAHMLDRSRGPAWAQGVPGGRINAAHGCLDRWLAARAEATAVAWEGDAGETRSWTLTELADEVARGAAALAACGVEHGDRVALYLPMVPETVAALLATLKL